MERSALRFPCKPHSEPQISRARAGGLGWGRGGAEGGDRSGGVSRAGIGTGRGRERG